MFCRVCGHELQECGNVEYEKFITNRNKRYYSALGWCPICDLITIVNPLSQDEFDFLYEKGDDYTNLSSFEVEKDNYIRRSQMCMSIIDGLNLQYESVLDIGASTGYMLHLFKEKGKEVYGIETSAAGCYMAEKRYGISLYKGYLEDYVKQKDKRQYDLVCMCHLLEHIVELKDFVQQVAQVNTRYLYVEVPSLEGRIQDEPYGFFAEEHINYFTPYSLNNLMRICGYGNLHMEIDYMRGYRIANGFPMIRAIFEKDICKTVYPPVLSANQLMKAYMDFSKKKMQEISEIIGSIGEDVRLGLWGASFQLERLFAYTTLKEKEIVCIIDNSKTRQGKIVKIANKEIEIKGIEEIDVETLDSILITSWNSQNAIINQMRKLGFEEKAITLYGN